MALADGRASKHPFSSGSNQEINQDGKTKRVRKVQNSKWEWKFGTIGEIIRGLMDTLTRYGMIKLNLGEDLQVCHADYIASRGRSWWNHQHSQLQLKFISEAIIGHVLLLFVMSDCRVVSNGFSGGGSFSMPGAYVCEKNKGSGRMNRRVASSFVSWGLKFKSTPVCSY